MKNFSLVGLLVVSLLVVGCGSDKKDAPVAEKNTTEVTTEKTKEAGAEKSENTLGEKCEEYFAFLEECLPKLDAAFSSTYQDALDQSRAQMEQVGSEQMEAVCAQGLEASKPALAQLGC